MLIISDFFFVNAPFGPHKFFVDSHLLLLKQSPLSGNKKSNPYRLNGTIMAVDLLPNYIQKAPDILSVNDKLSPPMSVMNTITETHDNFAHR